MKGVGKSLTYAPNVMLSLIMNLCSVSIATINAFKDDIEKTFNGILQAALGKLDLVTREEFEVQKMVLAKTRSKLEDLEKRVAEIEASFSNTEA